MKRTICAALALTFLLTLCACGRTGSGSSSAVSAAEVPAEEGRAADGTPAEERNSTEEDAAYGQSTSRRREYSYDEAYAIAEDYMEQEDYLKAGLYFGVAKDKDPTRAEAYLGEAEAYFKQGISVAGTEILIDGLDKVSEPEILSKRLAQLPADLVDQAQMVLDESHRQQARDDEVRESGVQQRGPQHLCRWEQSGYSAAEPLRPDGTYLQLFEQEKTNGEIIRASADYSWVESYWKGSDGARVLSQIEMIDEEGNQIITEYTDGEPDTTTEIDQYGRDRIVTLHLYRPTNSYLYWFKYIEYLPDTEASYDVRYAHICYFEDGGRIRYEDFFDESGKNLIERLVYQDGAPSYAYFFSYDERGKQTKTEYFNVKTGEYFDPDTDGYPD